MLTLCFWNKCIYNYMNIIGYGGKNRTICFSALPPRVFTVTPLISLCNRVLCIIQSTHWYYRNRTPLSINISLKLMTFPSHSVTVGKTPAGEQKPLNLHGDSKAMLCEGFWKGLNVKVMRLLFNINRYPAHRESIIARE